MKFKVYFKPTEFEANNEKEAEELLDSGEFFDNNEVEYDLIEVVRK